MRLFEPFRLREITFRNRIGLSPMCQYSAENGEPNHWHLVHLGSRAVGGAGLVMAEASAVSPEGRISPADTGLYTEEQEEAWRPITAFIKAQGAVPGIQLAHAGRKASTGLPWKGGKPLGLEEGGWRPLLAPSAIAFAEGYAIPLALNIEGIQGIIQAFRTSAKRALDAGFEAIEIHAAHGYLLHEFLSPLSNHRKDLYGGSLENRMRLPLEVAEAVRSLWPERLPLFVRISATDWMPGGWTLEESVELARQLKERGVDLIDVSSGGLVAQAKIPLAPGYQLPFAESIRREAQVPTAAVGLITSAKQAEAILQQEKADLVFLGREFLRDPYWALRAAKELGVGLLAPKQYLRAY